MDNLLNNLTEDVILQFAGEGAYNRAARSLAQGKVVLRRLEAEGKIRAEWDESPYTEEMSVRITRSRLTADCTCGELVSGHMCDHIIALLLAWVQDPNSFSEETFLGDDELDDFVDELLSAEEGFPPTSRPASKARVAEYDPYQDYRRLLSNRSVSELRALAHKRGVPLTGNRKEPIVETLVQALVGPESVEQAWQTLSENAKKVAVALVFASTTGNQATRRNTVNAAQAFGVRKPDEVERAVEELAQQGLVFESPGGEVSFLPVLGLWLPPEASLTPEYEQAAALKPKAPVAPHVLDQKITRLLLLIQAAGADYTGREPASHPVESKMAFLRGWPNDPQELDALVGQKDAYAVAWSHTFRIRPEEPRLSASSEQALSKAVGLEPHKLDFMLHLLEADRLVVVPAGKTVTAVQERVAAHLNAPPLERLRRLMGQYVSLQSLTEFAWTGGPAGAPVLRRSVGYGAITYTRLLSDLAAVRSLLVILIRLQPAGRWTSLQALLDQMNRLPVFRMALGGRNAWFFERNGQHMDPNKGDDFQAIVRPFVENVLAGPLRWLGAVEPGYSGGKMVAFRLTELGGFLLGQRRPFDLPAAAVEGPVLAFQPDGRLLLRSEAAGGDVLQVLTLAGEAEVTRTHELVYTLTPAGAGRAFASGWTAGSLLEMLEKAAGASAPPTLAEALSRWEQKYGSIHFYDQVALMELGDDFALGELLAGTSLARYLLYRFNNRLLAVRPEGVEALQRELLAKGYTPKVQASPKTR